MLTSTAVAAFGLLLASGPLLVMGVYPSGQNGYEAPAHSGSGYPKSGSGYAAGGHVGHGGLGGHGSGYYPQNFVAQPVYAAPVVSRKKLTEVDKLYARVSKINKDTAVITEKIENLQKRIVVLNQAYSSVLLQIQELLRKESTVMNENDELTARTANIVSDISDREAESAALISISDLFNTRKQTQNVMIIQLQSGIHNIRASVAGSSYLINNLAADYHKEMKLLYGQVEDSLDLTKVRLDVVYERMENEQCEAGTVTIYKGDPRAEVFFQRTFTKPPTVTHGISGYEFDLNARSSRSLGHGGYGYGYGGYASGYNHHEPNSIGVFVRVHVAQRGLTFFMNGQDFGDTELLSVKVSYQACTTFTVS